MSEHTKEPWKYYELEDDRFGVKIPREKKTRYGAEPYAVIGGFEPEDRNEMKANARRIVACVNACAGIDDPELWVAQMMFMDSDHSASLEIIEELRQQRDDLLAALKALEDACDKRVSCLSREAYLVAERCKGMKDALNALDDARHLARATISKVESEK